MLQKGSCHCGMNHTVAPEHTAVRVSLWRALHVELDANPHVLTDLVGLKLIDEKNWRERPDMNPEGTKRVRAAIVARARFMEDIVEEQMKNGVNQYVILGAGLDTFAQRRPDIASKLKIFEVDQPGPQKWKQKRLEETGYGIPAWLKFVPVDFEAGESWWEKLLASGFDKNKPAVVVSTGVTMYLTKEANISTLREMVKLAPGSTFATTFMLTLDLLEEQDRPLQEFSMKKARESGTPFISFFTPDEMLALAKEAGFKKTKYVSFSEIRERYFAHRTDGLQTASGEVFLVAMT